ncbi:MAG: hypothetical protein DWQ10_06155, partial [Calditrichaeota bacterium]
GGIYLLKNQNFSVLVTCAPPGQNGTGGHNHYDLGSFTLSFQVTPIIVDIGTYVYTKDFKERNTFRSVESHNTLFPVHQKHHVKRKKNIWSFENHSLAELLAFDEDTIRIKVVDYKADFCFEREFKLVDLSNFQVHDFCYNPFRFNLHLSPYVSFHNNSFQVENLFFKVYNSNDLPIENYNYSYNYLNKMKSIFFSVKNENENLLKICI